MASPRRQFFLVALFIMLSNVHILTSANPPSPPPSHGESWWPFKKVHGIIENRLSENENLSLHCKSKDNNLGVHNLKNGNPMNSIFAPTFGGTTLFYCSVTWSKGSVSYEAYEYYRDGYKGRCPKRCLWKVTKEGILGYADTKPPEHDATIFWNEEPPK